MQEQVTTNSRSTFSNLSFPALVALKLTILALWAWVFQDGLVSAISIWYGSDIFNHCLFVLPGAFYLMYLKRAELLSSPIKPCWFTVIAIAPLIALYAIGLAGDVQVFMHAAMFTLLPLLYWFALGTQAARTVLFPLVFILFCIPIGEELVPFLQEIAATFSVALIELSNVPVFRSGLYIEIPKGRFLVAEACSGISFFIASLVIGSLYAYINIQHTWRRGLFVLLSIVFPIVANILRVYGIIMIAYVSDMQYAVGADHLIYGWFFFAFVILCLLGLGELIRETTPEANKHSSLPSGETNDTSGASLFDYPKNGLIGLGAMLSFALVWYQFIGTALPSSSHSEFAFTPVDGFETVVADESLPWQTKYRRPTAQRYYLHQQHATDVPITVYQAFYAAGDGELISSINRFYGQDSWTKVNDVKVDGIHPFAMELISSPTGQLRLLAYWFVLQHSTFANQRETKIAQIASTLSGEPANGGVIALSIEVERRDLNVQQDQFNRFIDEYYQSLSDSVRLKPSS